MLLIGNAFAVDFNYEGSLCMEESPIFISLGSHCDIAFTLRKSGLRKAAFPFDWLVTADHDRFIKIFEEDFEFFIDEKSLNWVPEIHNSFKNSRYEVFFYHEAPKEAKWKNEEEFKQHINAIKIKYDRRIYRLRKLKQYPGKVFFLRTFFWKEKCKGDQNSRQAREIKRTLDLYFPDLNFTLVIINYTDDNVPNLEPIQDVIEFKINRSNYEAELDEVYKMLKVDNVVEFPIKIA